MSFLFAVNVGLWLFQSGRSGTDGRKERIDTRTYSVALKNKSRRRNTNETENIDIDLRESDVSNLERDDSKVFQQWDMERNRKGKACGGGDGGTCQV